MPDAVPSALASADSASRATDLADLAAGALERLARDQDDAARLYPAGDLRDSVRAALATSRGEAARAVGELSTYIENASLAEDAAIQARTLQSVNAIPSATLKAWAAAWRAYAGSAS